MRGQSKSKSLMRERTRDARGRYNGPKYKTLQLSSMEAEDMVGFPVLLDEYMKAPHELQNAMYDLVKRTK